MLESIIAPTCMSCNRTGPVRYGLCAACRPMLTDWDPPDRCRVCGMAIQGIGTICQRCLEARDWFDGGFFLFAYREEGRAFLHRVKFRDRLEWLDILAETQWKWGPVVDDWNVDMVTWIPAAPVTRWIRGYNVSREMARRISRLAGLPSRRMLSPGQWFKKSLSRANSPAQRDRMIRRFLKVRPPEGKHLRVLIVDDVLTTGATANRAAYLLKRTGRVDRVFVLTLARVT